MAELATNLRHDLRQTRDIRLRQGRGCATPAARDAKTATVLAGIRGVE